MSDPNKVTRSYDLDALPPEIDAAMYDISRRMSIKALFDRAQAARFRFETVGSDVHAEHYATMPEQRLPNCENNAKYVEAEARVYPADAIPDVAVASQTE